jgi:adenylyltransferase/sulfurtransferase
MPMEPVSGFTASTEYFSRQINLPELGAAGQARLGAARALVVGAGALGHPVALSLVLAGVNRLTLMDRDIVEMSNLHRQPLFTPADCGAAKAACAAARLRGYRSGLRIEALEGWFRGTEADRRLVSQHDIVIDATDRFSSKYLIHDACLAMGVALVSASVAGFAGQLHYFPFHQRRDRCLRCLYPEAPPDGCTGSCAEDGILGATAQILGNLEALTAVRALLGVATIEPFRTYQWNLARGSVNHFAWEPRPGCLHERPGEIAVGAEPCADDAEREGALDEPAGASVFGADERRYDVVIDLRPEYAFRPEDTAPLGTAPTNIPLAKLMADPSVLDPARSYLLVCERGIISRTARRFLIGRGFEQVDSLEGGLAWLRER